MEKRKTKKKIKVYGIDENFSTEKKETFNESLILHIPIKKDKILNDKEEKIKGYEKNEDYSEIDNEQEEIKKDVNPLFLNNDTLMIPKDELFKRATNIKDNEKKETIKNIKLVDILVDFNNENKLSMWPLLTTTACFWCCHQFSNTPVGIPEKFYRNKFYLRGCFCSYNCAASYIFNELKYDNFEKYSLLNFMYSKLNNCGCVKINLAPPKELLKLFGGTLSIEDYRKSFCVNNKKYNIQNYPLISMTTQLEEISTEEVKSNFSIGSNKKIPENNPIKQGNDLSDYFEITTHKS